MPDNGLPPELSLPIITGLGLVDSVNPCVIGVLILLLTILLKTGNKRAVLANGAAYVAGVYLTYLVGGLTLLAVFNAVRSVLFVSQILYVTMGSLIIFAGLLEVKDYFWYGRWFSLAIPKRLVATVEDRAAGTSASVWAAFSFGAILTLIELPCTGAPYLAILTLMSQSGYAYLSALPLLLYYNLIFVLPLAAIIGLAYGGFSLKRLEGWRQEHRGTMRLAIGIFLLAIGIWIVTTVKGALLIPLILGALAVVGGMAFVRYVLKFE